MLQPNEVVVSKFFITNKPMDESLSDFQPKKKLKYPNGTNSKPSTNKTRKKQKDIRKFLNDKKSDVVEDFENFIRVCRKANLDVDVDHLQLAIALSKSIQDQSDGCVAGSSKDTVNGKKSLGRVKQSLLEYGFNLPSLNTKKKRFTKQRKNSKLLKISEEERKQTVASKFAEVLFSNPKENYVVATLSNSEDNLFALATNSSYNKLRSDDSFVIQNIFKKEPNTVGCLLKDWTKIPGRPLSPLKQKRPIENFVSAFHETKNFDLLLSGKFKMIDEFIQNVSKTSQSVSSSKGIENSNQECCEMNNTNACVAVENVSGNTKLKKVKSTGERSTSPDIFSEESFLTMNSSLEILNQYTFDLQNRANDLETKEFTCRQSQISELVTNNTERDTIKILSPTRRENTLCSTQVTSQDFMDLTECVDKQRLVSSNLENQHITKSTFIFADDGMELTKCISTSHTNNESSGENINSKCEVVNEVHSYDLTQSSDSEESLPLINIPDKNVPLRNLFKGNEEPVYEKNIVIDLSHIRNFQTDCILNTNQIPNPVSTKNKLTSEILNNEHSVCREIISTDLNNVSVTETEAKMNKLIRSDDYVLETINCLDETNKFSEHLDDNSQFSQTRNISSDSTIYDLIQPLKFTSKSSPNKCDIAQTGSFHNLDLSLSSQCSEVFEISDEEIEYSMMKSRKDDIDTSDELDEIKNVDSVKSIQESSYVAVDLNTYENHSHHELSSNIDPPVYEDYENYDYCNNTSEKLDTWDLNCTMKNESKGNRPTSIDLKSNNECIVSKNVSKQSENEAISSELEFTPIVNKFLIKVTSSEKEMTVSTPGQHQYLLKTSNVTPMPEYASMQTVERNKELMKYGIRPFKRKRAVQLLEHLYRQTHPLCEDADPKTMHGSPSKRNKTEEQISNTNPNHASPNHKIQPQPEVNRILNNTPKKANKDETDRHLEIGNEKQRQISYDICHDVDNIFALTDERPQLAEVQYDDEDLVLPKGRMSKRAGCAVPLHIALWNLAGSARRLREAILRYEPVDIGALHRALAAQGHRYEPKELLRFLDRKGITVKTDDNAKRTKKR